MNYSAKLQKINKIVIAKRQLHQWSLLQWNTSEILLGNMKEDIEVLE
jgi:tetrahydrodipicolinate N-succinyltransferase